MSFCGTISEGANYDCINPIVPGLLPKVILINTLDIQLITIVNNVITDIALKAGKKGYLFEGVRQSVYAESNHKETQTISGFEHLNRLEVFDLSSTQKYNLEKLSLGSVISIVFNRNAKGNEDSYFEVLGVGTGLETSVLTRINNSLENSAAFSLELKTPDTGIEPKIPYSFFDTDYSTTLQKILDLLQEGENVAFPFTFPFNLA